MKQVQYNGEDTRVIPSLGFTVSKGDVIDVPDDFDVFNFSPIDKKAKTDVPPVVPAVTETAPTSEITKEN